MKVQIQNLEVQTEKPEIIDGIAGFRTEEIDQDLLDKNILDREIGKLIQPSICTICSEEFKLNDFEKHMAQHARKRLYICNICKMRFLHKCDLYKHIRALDGHEENDSANKDSQQSSDAAILEFKRELGEYKIRPDSPGGGKSRLRAYLNLLTPKTELPNKSYNFVYKIVVNNTLISNVKKNTQNLF